MPQQVKSTSPVMSQGSSPVEFERADQSAAVVVMSAMSSRDVLCQPEDDHVPAMVPSCSSRPRSGQVYCGDKRLVRKDTGISDHCDKARRKTDQEDAIKERLKSLQLSNCLEEDCEEAAEDDEGVASETASTGSASETCRDPPRIEVNPPQEDIVQQTPAVKLSTSSSGIDSAGSAEEEEEEDDVQVLPAVTSSRCSRSGPYKFKRRDTGLRDHEQKERRRSSEAIETKKRLGKSCRSTEIVEEEEEEEA